MIKNLIIVESPTKAKTIAKYLDQKFTIVSSFGHISDLPKKEIGIDVKNDFKPKYKILQNKKKIVSDLKKLIKKYDYIWLATDEDREGEAISWHLYKFLNIPDCKLKRISFHEITKTSIKKAIQNPRKINKNLVYAQQTRRVLDRLVGFKISPVLWKKIKRGLSAGRVQSVALRLIVEKEYQINNFKETSYYQVSGYFNIKNNIITANLDKKIINIIDVNVFMKKCLQNKKYVISKIKKYIYEKTPNPPFKTSTLQQEALKTLNFSIKKTMLIAQKLYEKGYITYIRTDSTNICQEAIKEIKKEIKLIYGIEYLKIRKYKNNTYSQEAHEAIRPTNIKKTSTNKLNKSEKSIYKLIKKRTLSSYMSSCKIEKIKIYIQISCNYNFILRLENIKFAGFIKIYNKNIEVDNNNIHVKKNDLITCVKINAKEYFTSPPLRYTEGGLVKKLENLKIGRPSTYAPIISTIQERNYVNVKDISGINKKHNIITMKDNKITKIIKNKIIKKENKKFIPTSIGYVVNEFLVKNFTQIMDYDFTAKIEDNLDKIAKGEIKWNKILYKFYDNLTNKIKQIINSKTTFNKKFVGLDPESKKKIWAKIGPFGPILQLGELNDKEKPKFIPLLNNENIYLISLKESLKLFKLPKTIGFFNNKIIISNIGKFGPYIKYNNKYFSIKKEKTNPMDIKIEEAIQIIKEYKKNNNIIKIFDNKIQLEIIKIIQGKFGPYIKYKNKNFSIPKNISINHITLKACQNIIKNHKKKYNKI